MTETKRYTPPYPEPDFIITESQFGYFCETCRLLEENKVAIQSSDVYGIAMIAYNLALIEECSRSISQDGMMIESIGDKGYEVTKPNPACNMQKDAQANLRAYLKEFRMSPNSRIGAGTITPITPRADKDSDGFDGLRIGGRKQ